MKKIFAMLLVVSMLLSLVACSNGDAEGQSKIDKIKEAGVLIVGTSADYPPYEFYTEIDGEKKIVGFDIAIADALAKSLDVELQIVDMAFSGLLISLDEGKFDIVMAGLTPDEERNKVVDFTDIFFNNTQIVIIREEDKDKFKTTAALSDSVVGVLQGTVQLEIAQGVVTNEDNIIQLIKFNDLITELKSGKIDAIFTNSLVATAYVSGNDDLLVQDVGIVWENNGFAGAVQKGNEDLLEHFNTLLHELNEEGSIDKFVAEAQEIADVSQVVE